MRVGFLKNIKITMSTFGHSLLKTSPITDEFQVYAIIFHYQPVCTRINTIIKIPGCSWNCMGWSAEDQALFVGYHLGPTLANKGFGDVKIMVVDDQRTFMPTWPVTVRQMILKSLAQP